jgi:hypothetical protein
MPSQGILFEKLSRKPRLVLNAASGEPLEAASLRLAAPGFFGFAVACAPSSLGTASFEAVAPNASAAARKSLAPVRKPGISMKKGIELQRGGKK